MSDTPATRVAIAGAGGRMGRMLLNLATADPAVADRLEAWREALSASIPDAPSDQ